MHPKRILATLLLSATACACTQPAPRVDDQLGASVRELRTRQLANPEAGRSPVPDHGLEARVARESFNVYVNSFRAPPPPMTVFNFGIGASSATQ